MMQLLLDLDDHARTLAEIHRRLCRCFGQPGAVRRLDPVSQLVMSLIGSRTRGAVSMVAFEALFAHFGSWEAVCDAQVSEIRHVIGAVTYAEVKAAQLKAALTAIAEANGSLTLDRLERMSVGDALAWLERLPSVGRKVSAATLNFSTMRKAALVIDTHHLRVLRRIGVVGPACTAARAYDRVVPLLPTDWRAADFDRHHCVMKRLGQVLCRHDAPFCRRCPLRDLCPTGTASTCPTHP